MKIDAYFFTVAVSKVDRKKANVSKNSSLGDWVNILGALIMYLFLDLSGLPLALEVPHSPTSDIKAPSLVTSVTQDPSLLFDLPTLSICVWNFSIYLFSILF